MCVTESGRQTELFSDQEAAQVSAGKSSDESHADQETLQLVSKLVQRLHSGSDMGSDKEEEDWAIADGANGAGPSVASNQRGKDAAGMNTEADTVVEAAPSCLSLIHI